jgi:Asp-tRNA(Asn)/Glu-tRNA(Gln) amidotransferase A subunit family amidase
VRSEPPAGLLEAVAAYEAALMSDDVAALDRLFAPGPTTLRGDAAGLLVGHDRISAFRGTRGGAPRRTVVATHVQTVDDDHALVVAVTELERGGRGQQTQLWERQDGRGWVVTAAHVSVPAPAYDARVWRVLGSPLAARTGDGPLTGETLAVKDLYAVAGQRVGAGNPAWEAAAAVEPEDAAVVAALRAAGADVTGISRTDEFAYSLAGTNAHHGTPPNPRAPHRVPGGSSSGSVVAVALGHVSIGLGTDTGGSIRVPAAYQGVWGIRTTHGAVDRTGLLPLAASYDTVGWFTRTPALLARVGDVLLPPAPARADGDLVVVPELLALAEPDVAAAVGARAAALGAVGAVEESWDLSALPAWRAAFTVWQAWEAWQAHGHWWAGRLDTLGADVRGRVEMASRVTEPQALEAYADLLAVRQEVRSFVGERVLVLPSASSVAPLLGSDLAVVREATLQLTCLAGIAGLPAVSVPVTTADGLPAGLCLVAAAGRDRDLLALCGDPDRRG